MNFDFWKNRKVFLTGHTGFKGGWTALWLSKLGSKVYGYSLSPTTIPNFFSDTKIESCLSNSTIGDILDFRKLSIAMENSKPSIVIHMAAQPLVRESYRNPMETFKTNIIGTANVLEAARKISSIEAIINITTDKVYENKEWDRAYTETDRLGGHDPYSSSKACAELITKAYRKSFFYNTDIKLSSVRAGNVIGGGDWAADRLIPDFFRAIDKNQTLRIRSPNAVRPWQHVLDPICGYLVLAEKLSTQGSEYEGAWNFGPEKNDSKTVSWIIDYLSTNVKESNFELDDIAQPHETKLLKIDSSKAKKQLGWKTLWNVEVTLDKTIEWYQAYHKKKNMMKVSLDQINNYEKQLKIK